MWPWTSLVRISSKVCRSFSLHKASECRRRFSFFQVCCSYSEMLVSRFQLTSFSFLTNFLSFFTSQKCEHRLFLNLLFCLHCPLKISEKQRWLLLKYLSNKCLLSCQFSCIVSPHYQVDTLFRNSLRVFHILESYPYTLYVCMLTRSSIDSVQQR